MKDVFLQRVIFGTLLFLVIGFGIVSLKHIKSQAQNAIAETVTQVQSLKGNPPKTPPLGETVSESGHWHGDEWHATPHAPVAAPKAEAEQTPTPAAEFTDAQGSPVGNPPQANAQIIERAVREGKVKLFSKRTPEYLEAVKTWQAWEKKAGEFRHKVSQASHDFFDAQPDTVEEIEQYETDKEWQRRVREIIEKMDEIYRMQREHEKKRPPAPYLR